MPTPWPFGMAVNTFLMSVVHVCWPLVLAGIEGWLSAGPPEHASGQSVSATSTGLPTCFVSAVRLDCKFDSVAEVP